MYIIKGFCVIPSVISNIPNETWRVGELSRLAMTYARDVTSFVDPSNTSVRLEVFSSKLNFIDKMMDKDDASVVLTILNRVVSYFRVVNLPLQHDDFLDYINMTTNISRFAFGQLVSTAKITLPEWIDFYFENNTKRTRVWFSDQAFTEQYDDYSIGVVSPVVNIDDFFTLAPLTLKEKILEISPIEMTEKIEATKNYNPETFIRTIKALFSSLTTPSVEVMTYWHVVIYGPAGDNIDCIKDAVADYILKRSTYTRDEWVKILPYIFNRTEFILLPRWDLIAIENMSTQTGLYSSVVDPVEAIRFCVKYINYYMVEHTSVSVEIIHHPYKTLSMCIVTGPDNENENTSFKTKFPDYLPVSSSSIDFNRMSSYTKTFIDLLEEMMILAEVLDEFTDIPPRYRRIRRDNKYYISLLLDEVQYLVASKVYY